ncbi:Thrombospondin-type laminin G domain and EAR repeat-containing protein [Durusdinium trenchii]|uniref:Thrombospondin-type laminin G domain and EAR repeat-containing protein n=1 Tax=Durusdinium trenchii TaxID=1381693 RepID=A0ABP0IPA0_9DINO
MFCCCVQESGDSVVEEVTVKTVAVLPPDHSPDFGTFTLSIPTADFLSLGLDLDVTSDTRPMIKEVRLGAVSSFNDANPTQAIKPYDVILALDGAESATQISETMTRKLRDLVTIKLSRPRKHQVQLEKVGNLGMKLEYCSNSAGAVIQEVASSGLLAKWNRSHPKDEIQPGDRTLKVNGMKCAGPDMVEVIKSERKLDFTVLKY